MAVQQILETTNGNETTITVITDDGNAATKIYNNNYSGSDSDRKEAITGATEEALKKDR